MNYPIPDKIPCRENGQPLYKFPKKGSTKAAMAYDLFSAHSHIMKPNFYYGTDEDDVVWQDNPVWSAELKFVELYSTGGSDNPYSITCILKHVTLGHFYALPYEHFAIVMKTRNFQNGVVTGKWQFERRGPYLTLFPVS